MTADLGQSRLESISLLSWLQRFEMVFLEFTGGIVQDMFRFKSRTPYSSPFMASFRPRNYL